MSEENRANIKPGGREKPRSSALPILGLIAAIGLIVAGALLAGRRDEHLSSIYGRRRGTEAGQSVNGTTVLSELFKKAGHRVGTRNRLSPRLEEYDVVVWIPDDFGLPTTEQREFLEAWLNGPRKRQPRTLVYVGRDYDASVAYWDHWSELAGKVEPAAADEALRRQAEARASHEKARSAMPDDEYARWFRAARELPPKKIEQLSGPWAEGIDPAKTDLHLEGRLVVPVKKPADPKDAPEVPEEVEVLLGSGDDALVTRVTNDAEVNGWGDGQVLVVTNGSFVLNYPLVNAEHRKLAARLVDECGEPGAVVFIESGAGGPQVLTKEPAGGPPTALDLLKVWPLNTMLLHLTALGIVLCLARSPIFGRPREIAAESPTDFGKHVTALGQLLARTKDRNYAQARLAQYRQGGERKSAKPQPTTK